MDLATTGKRFGWKHLAYIQQHRKHLEAEKTFANNHFTGKTSGIHSKQ